MNRRLVRLPRLAGIVPVSWRLLRISEVTRLPVTLIPSHEAMLRLLAQFRVAVPRKASMSPSRVAQSPARAAGSEGAGVTPVIATSVAAQEVCAAASVASPNRSTRLGKAIARPRRKRPMPGRGTAPPTAPTVAPAQ